MKLTNNQFDLLVNLMKEGATCKDVRLQLQLSESVAVRLMSFYKFHGKEETYDYYVAENHPNYTEDELKSITERLFLDNIAVDRGAIMFKASRKNLYSLMAKRKASEAALAVPCEIPKFSGELGQESPEIQRGNRKTSFAGGQTVLRTFPIPDEPPTVPCPDLPRVGKATAPVKSGRCKKKMRNKTVSEQNKQQKAIIEQHKESEKQEPVNETLGDIAERILGEFPKGIPASQYRPCQGRPCDIDIYSDGFDELPQDIQIKAYKIYNQKTNILVSALKKLKALVLQRHLNTKK